MGIRRVYYCGRGAYVVDCRADGVHVRWETVLCKYTVGVAKDMKQAFDLMRADGKASKVVPAEVQRGHAQV
jgi:hypothetical protein